VVLSDQELIDRSSALAAELAERARVVGGPKQARRQRRLARLLASTSGPRLVFSLADRVLRPVDPKTAAAQLAAVTAGPMDGLPRTDQALLRLAAAAARVAPFPVISLVAARLRYETRGLVYPAEPKPLSRRLAKVRRPNLNLLGEAVLGWEEASKRLRAVEVLMRRPDVGSVSVKVSAIAAGLSLVDFQGSVERVCKPLHELYRTAATCAPPKIVHLDMEEHRDLDITVEAFIQTLGRPELAHVRAGIALQAYLPDSHGALDRLLGFAEERQRSGGAPVRVRLVKGANLAMERVEAELASWPPAPYRAKADTDASYKLLLERLLEAARGGAVQVGVASHNLFDIAFGLVMADELETNVEVEMLAGMADGLAEAVAERTGSVLIYVPTVSRSDFRSALAYLARRLDENSTPEGFLRHALDLVPGSPAWQEQAERFAVAVRARHDTRTRPYHEQDRRGARPAAPSGAFSNEPPTDLTLPANRDWARAALGHRPGPPVPVPGSNSDIDAAVGHALAAVPGWERSDRTDLLLAAGREMAAGRADAVAVMASEAGKTFEEADPEVCEGVDYARWYGAGPGSFGTLVGQLDGQVESSPLGAVVVATPWNFPYAIPAGGALAALAAGNTVMLKPAPEAPGVAAVLVSQLHAAGVPPEVVQLVAAPDGAVGQHLVSHPDIGGVILTGSWETARHFAQWSPSRRLLAETSGKNSLIVSATADVDQAVRDVVRSAFGNAGQKCSAASLAIVLAPVYDRSPFLRQLADAVRSLRVGPATDPAAEVGPIVGPFTPALERALGSLDEGESWLVQPACLEGPGLGAGPAQGRVQGPVQGRLWSPGVRLGVRPGSWAHMTEWFGPVLGVMRAGSFEEALAWQNAVPYGLTAGLWSLDPSEQARWAEAVQAGNLYVNRVTTGAIVGRQPFGGWKRSSLGPTAKAGGPNYLIGLRRWRDAGAVGVDEAVASYRYWWDHYFSRTREMAGLSCESNELGYRPFSPGVVVRAGPGTSEDELRKAVALVGLTRTPLRISAAAQPAERLSVPLAVESAESFARSLTQQAGTFDGAEGARLRLLGQAELEVVIAAAAAGMTVLDEPICSHGRIEVVRWLREQAVSRSLHRYGNVVYPHSILGGGGRQR
jgi:RHH-type proline utilization regulon transcriptional repressor/proline dehydrogenase/delta 1-pyrroline-5-carboxylate dehydrogenase